MKDNKAHKWDQEIGLVEFFRTFQGEYPLLGSPVFLVRFPGCNLKESCPLDCDTKYSWGSDPKVFITPNQILAKSFSFDDLMITGGEPLSSENREQVWDLVDFWFKTTDSRVIIETNGTMFYPEKDYYYKQWEFLDGPNSERLYISISPKTDDSFSFLELEPPMYNLSLKVVVGKDFYPTQWASRLRAAENMGISIVLMPEGKTIEDIKRSLSYISQFAKNARLNRFLLSPRVHILAGFK